jgi:hypothetical protein
MPLALFVSISHADEYTAEQMAEINARIDFMSKLYQEGKLDDYLAEVQRAEAERLVPESTTSQI